MVNNIQVKWDLNIINKWVFTIPRLNPQYEEIFEIIEVIR